MNGETDSHALIKELLNKHWALRCELVGKQSVEDVINAAENDYEANAIFKKTEGGADFDMAQALKTIAEAAVLTKTCIEIYKLRKGRWTLAELEKDIRSTGVLERITKTVVSEKFAAILNDLARLS